MEKQRCLFDLKNKLKKKINVFLIAQIKNKKENKKWTIEK